MVLGANARVPFYNVEDDHPAPPQPYGSGGWLAGDRGVFVYDEYDVWLADPDTGAARNLTAGAGRRTHTVYSPVQTDPDAEAFATDKPLLLSLIDARTFASGYARVAPSGGVPATLLRADALVNGTRTVFNSPLHDLTFPPIVARARRPATCSPASRSARTATTGAATARSATRSASPTATRSRRSTAGARSG